MWLCITERRCEWPGSDCYHGLLACTPTNPWVNALPWDGSDSQAYCAGSVCAGAPLRLTYLVPRNVLLQNIPLDKDEADLYTFFNGKRAWSRGGRSFLAWRCCDCGCEASVCALLRLPGLRRDIATRLSNEAGCAPRHWRVEALGFAIRAGAITAWTATTRALQSALCGLCWAPVRLLLLLLSTVFSVQR